MYTFWKSDLGHFGWPKITFDLISLHFRSIHNFFFKMAAILEVRFAPKTIGFFHYVLSMAMPNMKLIGEFVTKAFWEFLCKMATRGHFVFPIDDKNHRVLVIWDLNGYGEYEFNRCICDKVMAKNIISPKFSNFVDIIKSISITTGLLCTF